MGKIVRNILLWALAILISFAAIVLCIGVLSKFGENVLENNISSSEISGLEYGLHMPDGLNELSEDSSVKWMAGIWVDLPECVMQETSQVSQIDTYESNGKKKFSATVVVQNGLDQIQKYYMVILDDGIPTDFSIDGKTYTKYAFMLSNQQSEMNIELEPSFSENLGRLDFLLFYDEDPCSDYHMSSYTVRILQSSEKSTTDQTSHLFDTIPQRKEVQEMFENTEYAVTLLDDKNQLITLDDSGKRSVLTNSHPTLKLESVIKKQGKYRTILMRDGIPIPFENGKTTYPYCDWIPQKTEMLSTPIQIDLQGIKSASIYTVSTPIDPEAFSDCCVASQKTQLINQSEKG